MRRNLMKKLFGPRGIPGADSTTLKKETKVAKINETDLGSAKFRGDLGKATGDASEHMKGRAEEAKAKIQKDFGKIERKV